MKSTNKFNTLIIVLVATLFVSGCSTSIESVTEYTKTHSTAEYLADAQFLESDLSNLESEFMDLLMYSDENACTQWINNGRSNALIYVVTDIGKDLVNRTFDIYEIMLDEYSKNGSIDNTNPKINEAFQNLDATYAQIYELLESE